MKYSLLLIVIFLFTRLTVFAEDAAFITRPGKHALFEDALQITVTEKEGKIFYTIGTKRFSGGNAPVDAISAKSNWFLLPVNKDQVWVYHGSGPLHLITVSSNAVSFDHSDASPTLLSTAPKNVLERMAH